MGIANTLSLSLRERTRELGLLRAVGLTRSQLRATVRWESVIIAGFGALGGIAAGVLVGLGAHPELLRRPAPRRVLGPGRPVAAHRGGRGGRRDPRRRPPGPTRPRGCRCCRRWRASSRGVSSPRWTALSIRPPHSCPMAHSSGSGPLPLWAADTSTVPGKQRPDEEAGAGRVVVGGDEHEVLPSLPVRRCGRSPPPHPACRRGRGGSSTPRSRAGCRRARRVRSTRRGSAPRRRGRARGPCRAVHRRRPRAPRPRRRAQGSTTTGTRRAAG